jgi:streptogramin lyase
MTADVQPTINGLARVPGNGYQSYQMPLLLDCPIVWQGGGGVTATFPIKVGDECLVVFASRDINNWFQQGWINQSPQMDPPEPFRMHNLSDGFAIVGLRSQPRAFATDTENAGLITDDGNTYVKVNPTTKAVAVQASGGINLNGLTIDSSGNLSTAGNISTTSGAVNAHTQMTVNGTVLQVP